MKKKLLIFIIILCMAMFAFAACGDSADTGTEGNEPSVEDGSGDESDGGSDGGSDDGSSDDDDDTAISYASYNSYYYETDGTLQSYEHYYAGETGGIFYNKSLKNDTTYFYSVNIFDENAYSSDIIGGSSNYSIMYLLNGEGEVVYACNPIMKILTSDGTELFAGDYKVAMNENMIELFIDKVAETTNQTFDDAQDFIATGGGTDVDGNDDYYLVVYPNTGSEREDGASRTFAWDFFDAFVLDTSLTLNVDAPDALVGFKIAEESEDGVLYTIRNDGNYSFAGYSDKYDETALNLTIPEVYNGFAVTSIDKYALYGKNILSNLVIPSTITEIGEYAFANIASSLFIMQSQVPSTWDSLWDEGFQGVAYVGIESVVTSNTDYDYVTAISNKAVLINYKGSATTITVESSIDTYDVIGLSETFRKNDTLTEVTLNEGIEFIGTKTFKGMTAIETVNIADSIESIGYGAFAFSTIKNVVFGDSSTLDTVDEFAFYNCASLNSITLPDGVTTIGDYAFWEADLQSFTFPSGVSVVGEWTFADNANLTTIDFANVTEISYSAFSNCTALETLTIPAGVETIADWAFSGCTAVETLIISEGVKTIGEATFYACTALKTVEISSTVEYIGQYAFALSDSIESFTVSADNANYSSLDDNLYNKDQSTLIRYAPAQAGVDYEYSDETTLKTFYIPESVTTIKPAAFINCANLSYIELGNLEQVGDWAFEGCTELVQVNIFNVDYIGSGVFGLTSADIYCSYESQPEEWNTNWLSDDEACPYTGTCYYSTLG